MAFVLDKFIASFVLVDSSGKKVNRRYQLNTIDPSTAFNSMNSIRDRLDIVSASKIMSATLERVTVDNAFTLPTGAENSNLLVVSALLAGKGDDRAKISIPAPIIQNFQTTTGVGSNKPNFSYEWLDLFLKCFSVNPPGSAFATISDGSLILLEDLQGTRKHIKS
jgi:hypothetical protein